MIGTCPMHPRAVRGGIQSRGIEGKRNPARDVLYFKKGTGWIQWSDRRQPS